MDQILEVRDIDKSYGDFQALKDISISVPRGSIFGLLGPNGAGKTTLIRIINQILMADKGEISINGERLNQNHITVIGYLPEERGMYKKMKVGEQLLYFAQLKGLKRAEAVKRIKEWLRKFEIDDWMHKKVEDLSKGMQQKIQFVGTVIHKPELLILDEPFSGFDPVNADIIKDEILKLREEGSTIIFSTHRMESVEELCDYIALINKSKKVLDGLKVDIKNQYRSNTFLVESIGKLSGLSNGFEVRNEEKIEDNYYKTSIQIVNDDSPNKLLEVIVKQAEIRSFMEKIPSVHDIFVESVKGKTDE